MFTNVSKPALSRRQRLMFIQLLGVVVVLVKDATALLLVIVAGLAMTPANA